MAEENVRPLKLRQVGGLNSGHLSFKLAAQPILENAKPTAGQKAIGEKTRDNLTEQAGGAIVAAHGMHLVNQVGQFALERVDEFMEFDRDLRKKRRNREDQVHMDQVCHHFRELAISAHAATFSSVTDRMVEIGRRPLTPDEEETETVIVEQDPGILGRLLGSTRTTTVKK